MTWSSPRRSVSARADALGQPSRVDEHQRRAMLVDQLDEAIVDLGPDLRRHDRFQRRSPAPRWRGRAGRTWPLSTMCMQSAPGNLAGMSAADQKTRDLFDRLLSRRQTDPGQPSAGQVLQALERQRRCDAALVAVRARGFRRRSRCARSKASPARIAGRAGCRATPVWSPGCAAACAACARGRPAACRRCAPRCGSRHRAARLQ